MLDGDAFVGDTPHDHADQVAPYRVAEHIIICPRALSSHTIDTFVKYMLYTLHTYNCIIVVNYIVYVYKYMYELSIYTRWDNSPEKLKEKCFLPKHKSL